MNTTAHERRSTSLRLVGLAAVVVGVAVFAGVVFAWFELRSVPGSLSSVARAVLAASVPLTEALHGPSPSPAQHANAITYVLLASALLGVLLTAIGARIAFVGERDDTGPRAR